MTDSKALREKLEHLFAEARARIGVRVTDSKTLNRRDFMAVEAVALDLLREKEEREAPCVWILFPAGKWTGSCGAAGKGYATVPFCPGCGHPVQVKQPQDAAEEE